ncbi:hypothetical protein [Bacillus sp. AFS023182]|nr:hypothetical protein [Bacillus sp. AFS023182]
MCEHKYQMLDSETTAFNANNKQFGMDVSAIFLISNIVKRGLRVRIDGM